MAPFDVLYERIPDERLSDLLTATNAAGFPTPALTPSPSDRESPLAAPGLSTQASGVDLPTQWREVRRLDGQSFNWPATVDDFWQYVVYAGETEREGTVHISLGYANRVGTWERDRLYVIAFLTSGAPQTALVEFLETDDHAETGEFIAVIRGRDGAKSKKMYGPGDTLPDAYATRFETVIYSDYIRAKGAWSKLAVLARQDDHDTMLNHALLQARRRGDI